MSECERGWTYLELIIALMVFSLVIVTVHPLLTVFNRSHIEKEMRLKGLWLAQEQIEQQMGHTAGSAGSPSGGGSEIVRLDGDDYEVSWKRDRMKEGLDLVEVSVLWRVTGEIREIQVERYILME